jgi:hypothetical protein
MTPDRYEPGGAAPRALMGFLQKSGSRMGMSTAGGFLFGGIFVGTGGFIMLIGTRIVRVDPASVHAPYWVLTAAGAVFLMGGLVVWSAAAKQFAVNRRRKRAARLHPGEPALADYPWHPEGFTRSGWPAAAQATGLAAGATLFLSLFNWWAFGDRGPAVVKVVTLVFDGLVLLLWWQAGRKIGGAFKFGRSRLLFTRFPYPLTEPVVLRWQAPDAVQQIRKGSFRLRCVQESVVTAGSGKQRSTQVAQDELWSATWHLEQPRNLPLKDTVELRYEIPPDAWSTQWCADRPIFWELEVKLDLPGLDFAESYFVPIYGTRNPARIKPMAVR